jgi:hypothetical protein
MHTLPDTEPRPLAYDLKTAARISSLGMTRLYELIAQGRLSTSKIGKRRLVHADSLHRLILEGF